MGTNFYRIPKKDELQTLKQQLLDEISKLDDFSLAHNDASSVWDDIVQYDWRDEQGHLAMVHLGKRSAGWKFLWNFHRNKFYSNKEELFNFIRSGRVLDEYGEEIDPDEFIKMATEWCPQGQVNNYSLDVDGLMVDNPSTDSTYFC